MLDNNEKQTNGLFNLMVVVKFSVELAHTPHLASTQGRSLLPSPQVFTVDGFRSTF